MNIQFMTEENAVMTKDSWTGDDKKVYIPDFTQMLENASCEEEKEAIRETEKMFSDGNSVFKGFSFEIVYTAFDCTLVYNPETGKQKWVDKWQIFQYPWIKKNGKYVSKEEMIKILEKTHPVNFRRNNLQQQ